MTTQSHQMTGDWQKIADGDIALSPGGSGGRVQVQDDGARTATLARSFGEAPFPGARYQITAGAQAVYAKGFLDDVWAATGAGALPGIDVRTLVPTPPAPDRLEVYERQRADDAYSWYINNLIDTDPVTGNIYDSTQSMATGAQAINIYNSEWVFQEQVVYNDNTTTLYDSDDHNTGALYFFDNKLIVASTGHGDDDDIHIRESTDTTPQNLGAATIVSPTTICTYTQFFEISGTLYLATQDGTREWALFRRDSEGSWTTLTDPITSDNQTYANMRAVGSEVRAACWDHPTTSGEGRRGIVYLHDFVPGDATQDITVLSQANTPATGRSARVLDFSRDASAILICDFEVGVATGQIYKVLRWSGSGNWNDGANWSEETVGGTESNFYNPSNYVAGGCFANTDGTLLWTIENSSSGTSKIKYWTNSGSWSSITVGNSNDTLARPICDPNNPGAMIVQELLTYPDFQNATMDTYVVYSDETIETGDWDAPLPPVAGLRVAPQIQSYFDDPNIPDFEATYDLSAAEIGDEVFAVFLIRASDSPDLDIGGIALTTRSISDQSQPIRIGVASAPYEAGMASGLLTMLNGNAASYQKVMVAIVTPGYTINNSGNTATAAVGDLVLGCAHSGSDASAAHTYSTGTQIDI